MMPDPPPAAPAPTIADLAVRYLEAHVRVNCRPGTVTTFESVLRRHIVPELGHLHMADVDRAEVAALHDKLRATPWQANQTVRVLASMFRLAEAWGMTPPHRNPCRSVRRYRERGRERFPTPEEYLRLGRVLDAAEADGSVFPTAVPALRLLLLTGCRKQEVLSLQWDDVDPAAGGLRLRNSRSGWRSVPLTTTTISRRTVEALTVGKDTVFWESELSGFGVRVYPSGSKVYVVQTRAGRRPAKRVTVGHHGVVTAEEARRRAALVIARIKAGEEPLPETPAHVRAAGPTVGELARQSLDGDVTAHCKPRTARQYAQIVERHLLPRLGRVLAAALDHAQVAALHRELRATPPTANRTVAVLARIWTAAEDRGLPPEGGNPCRLVVRNRERPRERFLSEAETDRGVSVHAIAAIRLLLLTGCRKNEILTLRWSDVDLAACELKLEDAKTGPRVVPLSPAAVAVLAGIPRIKGNQHVIPGKVEGASLRNVGNLWRRIRARAGLGDVHLHDCRHSFASRALALGEGLPMIDRLLGHARVETTARYAHLTRDSVRRPGVCQHRRRCAWEPLARCRRRSRSAARVLTRRTGFICHCAGILLPSALLSCPGACDVVPRSPAASPHGPPALSVPGRRRAHHARGRHHRLGRPRCRRRCRAFRAFRGGPPDPRAH